MNEQINNVEHILSLVEELEPRQIRDVFITMWRDVTALNDGLTADDCIEIFSGALKGSSDCTYDLLKQTCGDYGVGTMTETFVLLPRERYDKLFSDCLKGEIPEGIRLDTEALINLLTLENVADVEASIRKGCINATHSMGSDMKYIYDVGIDDEEIQWKIEDFQTAYAGTWWTIDFITHH